MIAPQRAVIVRQAVTLMLARESELTSQSDLQAREKRELMQLQTPADHRTHLECLAKLVAHYVVQQRINAGGEKVEHAGCIVQYVEHVVEPLRLDTKGGSIDSHQALSMKRRPADEEGNCHSD